MARPGLTGHRKFRRLVRALGSPILARGALELLWDSCYEAGDDYVGTAEDIEHAVGWSGEAGLLTQALAEAGAPIGVGFIERLEGTGEPVYRVHDLWHHAPDYVAKRRRRELERQGKSEPTSPPDGAERRRTLMCLDGDVRTPSPSPSPSPSPGKETSDVFLSFPVVGGGKVWKLIDAQVQEWASLFPNLDVKAEARKALAWITANPGRRKTERGMRAFLVNWLSRATNSGRGAKPAPAERTERTRDYVWPCPHGGTCGSQTNCRTKQILERARGKAS